MVVRGRRGLLEQPGVILVVVVVVFGNGKTLMAWSLEQTDVILIGLLSLVFPIVNLLIAVFPSKLLPIRVEA
jgi:hypothetical protein